MKIAPDQNEASGFLLRIDGAEMTVATGRGAGLNLFYHLPPGKEAPPGAQLIGYAKGYKIEFADMVLSGLYSFFVNTATASGSPFICYREELETDGRPANQFITIT